MMKIFSSCEWGPLDALHTEAAPWQNGQQERHQKKPWRPFWPSSHYHEASDNSTMKWYSFIFLNQAQTLRNHRNKHWHEKEPSWTLSRCEFLASIHHPEFHVHTGWGHSKTCQYVPITTAQLINILSPKLFYRALRLSPTYLGVTQGINVTFLHINLSSKPNKSTLQQQEEQKKMQVFPFILISDCQHFLLTVYNVLQCHGSPPWRCCVNTPHCTHGMVTLTHGHKKRRHTKPYLRWLCWHTMGTSEGSGCLQERYGSFGAPLQQPTTHLCTLQSREESFPSLR